MLVNLSRRLKTFEKFYFTASSQFAVVKSELTKIDTVQPCERWKVFTLLSHWTLGEKQLLGAISWWHRLSRVRLGNGVSAVGRCAIQPQRIEGRQYCDSYRNWRSAHSSKAAKTCQPPRNSRHRVWSRYRRTCHDVTTQLVEFDDAS